MNLHTISDRYTVTAIDAADAPDYALGAPKRVTDVPEAEPERWVPTETRGYQRSTTTGAVRKTPEYASAPATPPWGPCGVLGVEDDGACCVPSVDDFRWAVSDACLRGITVQQIRSLMESNFGAPRFTLIAEDKRAAVIAALNALGA